MDKKTIILFAISLAILGIMLYWVGIDQVINALKTAKIEYIAIGFVMQIFTYYLYTLRWKILNNLVGINMGIKKLLFFNIYVFAAQDVVGACGIPFHT